LVFSFPIEAVLVPAGTAKDIDTLLHREIVKSMALPDLQAKLPTLGYDVVASTREEFATRIRRRLKCGPR